MAESLHPMFDIQGNQFNEKCPCHVTVKDMVSERLDHSKLIKLNGTPSQVNSQLHGVTVVRELHFAKLSLVRTQMPWHGGT